MLCNLGLSAAIRERKTRIIDVPHRHWGRFCDAGVGATLIPTTSSPSRILLPAESSIRLCPS